MSALPHAIVDVFATEPFEGSPIAVVLEADSLSEERILDLAEWFPHEETVFVLSPTEAGAHFRTRAFRSKTEVRFAGLSTLAAARAWLDHEGRIEGDGRAGEEGRIGDDGRDGDDGASGQGGPAARRGTLVQQSDVGLTPVQIQDETTLRFTAPPLYDRGEPDELTIEILREVLGLDASQVRAAAWLDSGTGFLGLLVDSAETVLAMEPGIAELGQHMVGVLGPHAAGGPADFELRSFAPSLGTDEQRATATLVAAFASWLAPRGLAPSSFTVAQGRAVGHSALMSVTTGDDGTWVGGSVIARSGGTIRA